MRQKLRPVRGKLHFSRSHCFITLLTTSGSFFNNVVTIFCFSSVLKYLGTGFAVVFLRAICFVGRFDFLRALGLAGRKTIQRINIVIRVKTIMNNKNFMISRPQY